MCPRASRFIDFDTGVVTIPPMNLIAPSGPRANQPIEVMLDIFECRVDVWQFGAAVQILKLMEAPERTDSIWMHAGYSLLATMLSYFEMVGKILNPVAKSKSSKNDFKIGFLDVYPRFSLDGNVRPNMPNPIVDQFQDRLRNGLYHLGYTKSHLYIHNDPAQSMEDFDTKVHQGEIYYLVNPHGMTRTLVRHFPTLMERLRKPDCEHRVGFKRFYVRSHQVGSAHVAGPLTSAV